MSEYLFAYGFLKSRFHGNEKTETPDFGGELIGEGYFSGRIYRVNVYPGVVFDDQASSRVKGEIYKLTDPGKTLKNLDRYENASPLVQLNPEYMRRLRPIETKDGMIECWVYEYLHPVNPATEILEGEF